MEDGKIVCFHAKQRREPAKNIMPLSTISTSSHYQGTATVLELRVSGEFHGDVCYYVRKQYLEFM
jgi:hypothetical protein